MSKPRTIDAQQTQVIKDHLDLMFEKATPEYGDEEEETQQEGRKIFRPKPVSWGTPKEYRGEQVVQLNDPDTIVPVRTHLSC